MNKHFYQTSSMQFSIASYCYIFFFFHIQDAIIALNTLQTNAATLQKSISRTHDSTCLRVKETEKCLEKVGITLDKLDQLSVIHVAGTKGKVNFEPFI